MASSSKDVAHLRRRKPRINFEDSRNDTVERVEGALAAPSSSLGKVKGNSLSFDPLSFAASPSVIAQKEGTDTPSDTAQQHTTSKNRTSPLKKQIFLSHSSDQGSFVEQLDEDLRNEGYLPFFHKDPASLPKGEKFPERIFQFARECDVAVVVLSEKYLLSKWPMLELATFCDAQKLDNKKILPLFYELEVSALKDVEMRGKMFRAWETYAKEDARIDPIKWGEAVRALSSINGEVYDKGSEVAYRKRIVKSIYNLCPPDVEYVLPNVEGKERLCQLVAGRLDWILKDGKTATLGVYGMGGLGKTSLCKALCTHLSQRFYGRVCYLDFGSEDLLALKKEALRRLTDLRSDSILDQFKHEVQVDDRLEALLPRQDVFVAIDNLPPEVDPIKWSVLARILGPLTEGSMCILTSRSAETLKVAPCLEAANIMPCPSLTEPEAMNLFVRSALPTRLLSSLTPDESEVVRTCVNLCVLCQHSFDHVYHPMAVEALGYSLRRVNSRDPLDWNRQHMIAEQLADDDLDKIYKIIDKLYNTLNDADKLLFMDVAVFAPREKLLDANILSEWLAEIHETDERRIRQRLGKFSSLSLLELGQTSVWIHDFYVDFAHFTLQSGSGRMQERCVFKGEGDPLPWALQSSPSGNCRENLVRVRLQVAPYRKIPTECVQYHFDESRAYIFPRTMLKEWANLVVLHLEFGGKDIDIGPLRCLRSLTLKADHNLKTFTCGDGIMDVFTGSKPGEQLRFVKFYCMAGQVKKVPSFARSTRLQELDLNVDMMSLPKPVTLPPPSEALTILRLRRWYSDRQRHELKLGAYPNLIELVIESEIYSHGYCKLHIMGLSQLRKLKKLVLLRLPIVGPLLGLEFCTNLESLVLRSRCSEITSLPRLDCFPNLYHISVSGTNIEELKGVENLSKLQELYCLRCVHLRSLPDLSALPILFIVNVRGCSLLENVAVPDCCADVPPNQEVTISSPLSSFDEAMKASNVFDVLLWTSMKERFAGNAGTNPSLPAIDADEGFGKQVEQELERLTNIGRQSFNEAKKYMEQPYSVTRIDANFKRMKRDMERHYWNNLDIYDKLIHIRSIYKRPIRYMRFIVLIFFILGGCYLFYVLEPIPRKQIVIKTVVKSLCQVITGADWVTCDLWYMSTCGLVLEGFGNKTSNYCI